MVSYNEILNTETFYLKSSCLTHHEFRLLFTYVTGKDFNPVDAEETDEFSFITLKRLLERRADGEPIQYLIGRWPFLDLELIVDDRALIPRPETELLALKTAEIASSADYIPCVVDLCSGTGAIALYIDIKVRPSQVYAIEISPHACDLILENKTMLNSGINVINSDAEEYLESLSDETVDIFVSNPPYVDRKDYEANYSELKYEPEIAFLASEDGLYFYNHMSPLCYRKLKHGGHILYEIGEDQGEQVKDILIRAGFSDIDLQKDIFGSERYAVAKKI